jgi:hypothetical protein
MHMEQLHAIVANDVESFHAAQKGGWPFPCEPPPCSTRNAPDGLIIALAGSTVRVVLGIEVDLTGCCFSEGTSFAV